MKEFLNLVGKLSIQGQAAAEKWTPIDFDSSLGDGIADPVALEEKRRLSRERLEKEKGT